MKNRFKVLFIMAICYSGILTITGCKKEATIAETSLLDMSKQTAGFTWYKNSDALLPKSSGTGHSQPKLRTRFNAIASTKLDANYRVMSGVNFPEGSLIVKELFNSSNELVRYAILYKNASNADADPKGWVWGYINADGTVAEPSSNKGSGCISCHSQSGSIDYMLMNKYFQ